MQAIQNCKFILEGWLNYMLSTSKEYCYLFNKMTDIITQLDSLKAELVSAQLESEELFLSKFEEEAS